jgi:hypothetical protein
VENRFGRRELPGKGMLLKNGGLDQEGVRKCIRDRPSPLPRVWREKGKLCALRADRGREGGSLELLEKTEFPPPR